ncbi:FaeA/PapI family transcriptional regulator [Pyrococcus sp. ST04]|uniref:FaeA/PapI family transcriptional regulator n=1 Tax=Pyrococcus sp. ST04 TaxID=1183377 RepID=UPI0002605B73|nr:FaeA/PapI family transcriptional regulator [Pyrococcus sp. ST04]AFK22282.1 hypothetical protein Py04_0680 [Pyrococcus sp. ST04]
MKHIKILEALENGEKTEEEISKATGLSRIETRRFLLRLAEQGKVESFQKGGKIYWRIREEKPEEKKFKYV